MNVSNGTWRAQRVLVGDNAGSDGRVTIAGGTSMLAGDLIFGDSARATGVARMTGGQLVVTNADTIIGDAGFGVFAVSNGTVRTAGVRLGLSAGGQGTVNI